jgi:hypothetical protein
LHYSTHTLAWHVRSVEPNGLPIGYQYPAN